MKIRQALNSISIDLTPAEASVFLEELSNVRGGARLPKIRQVCAEIERSLALLAPPIRRRKKSSDPDVSLR